MCGNGSGLSGVRQIHKLPGVQAAVSVGGGTEAADEGETNVNEFDVALDFSEALAALKDGAKISREGWNAAGQYAVLQKGYPDGIPISANTAEVTGIELGTVCVFRPYLMLCTADGSFVPWAPTVSDVLAEDWSVTPVS